MHINKTQLSHRFNAAVLSYEQVANVQHNAAQHLVQQLVRVFPELMPNTIVDVGAGTGFVTELLLPLWPQTQYTLIDISLNMLTFAKKKFNAHSNIHYCLGDMETLPFKHHDLMISNFALQWANDLIALLHNYYQQANYVAFSCLTKGTFAQWGLLWQQRNFPSPLFNYPLATELIEFILSLKTQTHYYHTQTFSVKFSHPAEFLIYLKQLGANYTHTNISLSQLKKIMRSTAPLMIDYEIFFGLWRK